MSSVFHYVYILRSVTNPRHYYVGMTTDLDDRLRSHNADKCVHTKYLPWRIDTSIALRNKSKAIEFEKYLKSHSGRAFAKKHF